jgi:hypothetical protein
LDADDPRTDDPPYRLHSPRDSTRSHKLAHEEAENRRRQGGQVERSALRRVLDAGIGSFLGSVQLIPRLDAHQRFVGWEIVRFAYPSVDLYPGDVVLAVNHRVLERPDDALRLWDDLRASDVIEVVGERNGVPFRLRYQVVDTADGGAVPATRDTPRNQTP